MQRKRDKIVTVSKRNLELANVPCIEAMLLAEVLKVEEEKIDIDDRTFI